MILTKDPDSKYLYHQTEQQTSSRNLAVTSMRADMQYENPYLPICDTVGYPCKTDTKYRLPASPPASPSTQSARPKYCALQGLPAKIRHSSDLLNHSQEYRQALFLNWVAYERLFDDRILREERLRCPLLWCRKHFGDPRQLSEHVKNCERLSEGEYWCPQHQSPERWAAAPASKKHRSSLKLSICLKHAVRIIRRLGSRRPKKTSSIELEAHHTYQQAPANYMLITTNKDITTEQCEAELSTRSCELKIELPTTISRCYELQSPLTCHGSDLPFGAIIDVDMDMGTVESESSTSAASLSVSPIEDDYDIIDSEASSPMSPCYTIDATTRLLSFDEEDLGSRLCSPVFVPIPNLDLDLESQHEPASRNGLLEACPQNGFSFVLMQADLNKRSDAPPPLPIETRSHHDAEYSDEKELCSINYDAQSPPQSDCNALTAQPDRSHPALTATAMYDHDHGTGTDFHMHNQHDLVEGLRRVSPMLYKRSLRNLRRDAMTPAVQSFVDSMPSTEVIIERGLASLRKVFSGNLPNQIMEIYAMLHVAFVVAIVINQKDVAEVQKDLYADILNWSLAIRSVNERALFVHIAQRMWASEHSKLHCPRFVNDDLPGMLNQTCFTSVLPAISELPAPCSSTTNNPKTSTSSSTISNDTNVLLHALKKGGTAIYLCRQYLDVLEYTGLLASARGHDLQQMRGCLNRTPSEEVTNTAQNWETMVTRPLIEFMGLEGFRSIVINVQKLLANGIFENLREAELKLMFDAQHCYGSPTQYHKFLREVQRLCHNVSSSTASCCFSYDDQYKRNLDVTWRILYALKKRDASPSLSSSFTSTSSNSSGRMTTKDLPPLMTDSRVLSLPSGSSKVSSSASTSDRTFSSASSGQTGCSFGSAISSSSSFSLFKSPLKEHGRNGSVSSTKEPQTPSHRRTSRSSGSPTSHSRCPQCDELFTGIYHKTNLTRHLKTTCIHRKGKGKRLPCPSPLCNETFTRSDNLKTHQRKFGHE